MRFSSLHSVVFILLLTILFSGCSNIGIGKKAEEKVEQEEEQAPLTEPPAEGEAPVFVAIPSPYQPGLVPEPAKREFAKAKTLIEAQKWNEALGVLDLMAETYPTLSGPYVNLGIVYQQLNEPEKAEKALQFALETNNKNFDAYTQLGVLYREMGRFDEAETVYKNALSLWPHHLASVKNLGVLYDLYMGRFEEALAQYELSQQILGGEDRQLKGWIADLKRRMSSR